MAYVRPENLEFINPIVGEPLRIARKHQGLSKAELRKYLNANEIRHCEKGQSPRTFRHSTNTKTDYFFVFLNETERI